MILYILADLRRDRQRMVDMAATEVRVAHRALDGRRFLLSGALDLGAPATSVVELGISGSRREFTAGPLGLADEVAEALGISGFDEEFRFSDGTLLVARTEPYDPQTQLVEERLTAVWRGRRYCFFTQLYRASTVELLAALRTLRITEHADGVAIAPNPKSGTTLVAPASVLKEIPGLGLLELAPLTTEQARQLPSWTGLRTSAGELFRDTLSDGRPYFALATAEIWATLVPLADTAADRVPELLDRLRLGTEK